MQYLAIFAVMAMLGAGAGGATVMAAGFGHGAPDDAQAQNQWTGPADFGHGPGDDTGDQNQYRHGCGPADDAGDGGYRYQLEADADGDGIPNGQDPDWVPPEDGSGYQHKRCKP